MSELPELLKGRKASAVFLDYCKPLLEGFADEGTIKLEMVEKGLRFPWTIWNSVVLDEIKNDSFSRVGSLRMHIRRGGPHGEEFLNFWIKRKKEEFSEYKYTLSEYKLRGKDIYDFILRVESRDPSTSKIQ